MLNRQSSGDLIRQEVVSFDITLYAELTDWKSVTFTCIYTAQTARADKAGKQTAALILTGDKWLRQFLSVYKLLGTDSETTHATRRNRALTWPKNSYGVVVGLGYFRNWYLLGFPCKTIYSLLRMEQKANKKTNIQWASVLWVEMVGQRKAMVFQITTLSNCVEQKSLNLHLDGLRQQKTASGSRPVSQE